MSDDKASKPRSAVGVISRVVFPFRAIGDSVRLTKREIERNRESLGRLRELKQDASETIRKGFRKAEYRDESFEAAMARRSQGALELAELRRYFLGRKRAAVFTGLAFAIFGLMGLIGGLVAADVKGSALSVISILASQPLCFMFALSAQLRLWQLQNKRLSSAEGGGLKDFVRSEPRWWLITIDPELGTDKGGKGYGK
jgi:hypothetical protein